MVCCCSCEKLLLCFTILTFLISELVAAWSLLYRCSCEKLLLCSTISAFLISLKNLLLLGPYCTVFPVRSYCSWPGPRMEYLYLVKKKATPLIILPCTVHIVPLKPHQTSQTSQTASNIYDRIKQRRQQECVITGTKQPSPISENRHWYMV